MKPATFFTIATIAAAVLLTSCSTPPTPEQITAYSNAASTVVHSGAQDYKDVVYAAHQH